MSDFCVLQPEQIKALIAAGDALLSEVQIDAGAFEESGDHTQADILAGLCKQWQQATQAYRVEERT
jgi:hypothetical protein